MSLQNRREKWGQDATVPISDAFDADPADGDEILVEDLDDKPGTLTNFPKSA